MKFTLTLAVWLVSAAIDVCSLCSELPTPCQWYALHHGQPTFIGTALSRENVPDIQQWGEHTFPVTVPKTTFRVEETFEGTLGATVDVYGSATTLDYHFQVGTRYLVYAVVGKDGRVGTAKCTRTAPVSEAGDDISFLRSLPTRTGGTIQGLVRFVSPGAQSGTIAGTITAAGVEGEYKARVPASGEYEVNGLPPGSYRETFAPDDDSTEFISFTLKIPVNASCAGSGVRLGNLTVSGQAISERGKAVPNMDVFLYYALDGRFEKSVALKTRTDRNGRFSFHRVEASKFILMAEAQSGAVFFPGTTKVSEAQLIETHDGEPVSGLTIRLPASEPEAR